MGDNAELEALFEQARAEAMSGPQPWAAPVAFAPAGANADVHAEPESAPVGTGSEAGNVPQASPAPSSGFSAFNADPELLQEFLTEAGELLADIDRKLVELEKSPRDAELLAVIFRGFHTIKGGAGFLDAGALVDLCHRTESLFDLLRSGRMHLDSGLLDIVLAATAEVERMFAQMQSEQAPHAAPPPLLEALSQAAADVAETADAVAAGATVPQARATPAISPSLKSERSLPTAPAAVNKASVNKAAAVRAEARGLARETTLRVDAARFDYILNLSGEIGLLRTRLSCLTGILTKEHGRGVPSEAVVEAATDARKELPAVVGQLDSLVADLQNAVMKARMQPVGRVFQKYLRLARDLGRQLGKDIGLELVGENTEVDKTIIDELNDPLVHLLRNAIDHGVETVEERLAAGKPAQALVRIAAIQAGENILIEISDDGKGMSADRIRERALEKGLISPADAGNLSEKDCLDLIFLPGFSTKDQISDISGRGVGMDVVKTHIRKLNGHIEILSTPGKGTLFRITLPLTLAILPVLMLRVAGQPYALPLSAVREIIDVARERVQQVAGTPAIVVRGEVLPLISLGGVLASAHPSKPSIGQIERKAADPHYGVVIKQGYHHVILGVDAVAGQADVMIKPLAGVRPRGVAGATLSGEGELVLVLDLNELLDESA